MAGIGFFAPLPLALMLPFMAGQSMLMGDAFGKAYQYGKRKISAMSNEEFNKLTPQQLSQEIATDYSQMIPSLSTAIQHSQNFQSLIIQELTQIVRNLPQDIIAGTTGSQELGSAVQSTSIFGIMDSLGKIIENLTPKAFADDTSLQKTKTDLQQLQQTFASAQQPFHSEPAGPPDKRSERDIQIAKDLAQRQRETATKTSAPDKSQFKTPTFITFITESNSFIETIAAKGRDMLHWDRLADKKDKDRLTYQRRYAAASREQQTAKKKLLLLAKRNSRSPDRETQRRATQLNGNIQQGKWF